MKNLLSQHKIRTYFKKFFYIALVDIVVPSGNTYVFTYIELNATIK